MGTEQAGVGHEHLGLVGPAQPAGQSHLGTRSETIEIHAGAFLPLGCQVARGPVMAGWLGGWIGGSAVFQLVDEAVDVSFLEAWTAFRCIATALEFRERIVRQFFEPVLEDEFVGGQQRFVHHGPVRVAHKVATRPRDDQSQRQPAA